MPNFFNTPYGLQAGCARGQAGNTIKMVSSYQDLTFAVKGSYDGQIIVNYIKDGINKTETYDISDLQISYVTLSHDPNTIVIITDVVGNLWELECPNCGLTSISVGKCDVLEEIDFSNNLLTRCDVAKASNLSILDVSNNPDLSNLKFGHRPIYLQCNINISGTNIQTLDMSGVGICDIKLGLNTGTIISSNIMGLDLGDDISTATVRTIDSSKITTPIQVEEGVFCCGIFSIEDAYVDIVEKEKFITDLPTAPIGDDIIKICIFKSMTEEQNARIQAKGWATEM